MIKWANHLFHTDFTSHATGLSVIPVGPLSADDRQFLAGALNEEDMNEDSFGKWDENPTGKEYSLEGVVVCYNGKNLQQFPTNSTFKNVLMLQFPEDSVAPQNKLNLQYN